ncbi:TTR-45 protein, partial [Aphelenchoides avenae]
GCHNTAHALPLSISLFRGHTRYLSTTLFVTAGDGKRGSIHSCLQRASEHCRRALLMKLLLALLALSLVCVAYAMREQAVAVKGQLLCGAAPASGVHVKLWDEDDGKPHKVDVDAQNTLLAGPDPDDVLDEKHTDAQGNFHLAGSTRELTNIDPVFKIYHDCDDGIPGQRKVKLRIPSQYITSGGSAKRVFDVGILNLETIFPGEERDLL